MTYIKVKVVPNQKKEEMINTGKDRYEIRVKEKAEDNKANNRVIEILNNHFSYPEGGIHIVNGHHHPVKLIKIGV